MNVGAISSQKGLFWSYTHLSSGKRINTAKDDAAGLAIANKMKVQEAGLKAGAENAGMAIGAANVAEGALGGMSDYLQRIRELAVRSMNGLNSNADKQIYQKEIDQLKQGIEGLARDTSFNEQKLLDGSMADMAIATSPNGGSMHIQMENSTLEALGIADLDVTSKDFSLDAIDRAMDMVTQRRASLGGATNALEYTRNYNNSASINQLSARSRLEDLDFPKAIAKKKQDEVLGQYRVAMLRRQMDQKRKSMTALF
ncbi:MAG: flagellin [Lachnospiraceae bacterium]|nr:flagellin [Lachnospiraceae bacterium]